MKKIFIGVLLFSSGITLAQSMRVTLNNNSFIVLDNSANLVLDNPNPNAITTLGSGGNIVSENETDVVKWNIVNTTGAYTVPFTTKNGVKIPATLNITTAGSNDGYITFSTHTDNDAVNSWNNFDYKPTGVTNMYGKNGQSNNSTNVIDRFWTIDQQGYTSNPQGTLTLAYDDNERTATGNTIAAGTLVGQYWDEGAGIWYYQTLTGTDNYPTFTVSGIQTGTSFFKNWTLSSSSNPLPIELVEFAGKNEGKFNHLSWVTETEINNDYFTLERSTNSTDWQEVKTIDGAGNSLTTLHYSFDDYRIQGNTLYYYRLKQTDFDGNYTYSPLVVIKTNASGELVVFPNPSNGMINISSNNTLKSVQVLDLSGKVIRNINRNFYQIDLRNLAKGVYVLKVEDEFGVSLNRIIIE